MAADLIQQESISTDVTLPAAREIVAKSARVIQLVVAGNKKLLSYPWRTEPIDLDDRKPMYLFGKVGHLLSLQVRVLAADGHSAKACSGLTEAFKYADRISYPSTTDTLLAYSVMGSLFRELLELVPRLGEEDAQQLIAKFNELVRVKQPFVETYLHDVSMNMAMLAQNFEKLTATADESAPGKLATLSVAEKSDYVSLIRQELEKHIDLVKTSVSREERYWSFDHPVRADPILDYAVTNLIKPGIAHMAVRLRTQYRLASLHCLISVFRSKHRRLPESLEELGARTACYDPASGRAFYYSRVTPQSYVLHSAGTPDTGRIDLAGGTVFR